MPPEHEQEEMVERVRKYPVTHMGGSGKVMEYNFIILPKGVLYNSHIEKARKGDFIKFLDGEEREIYDICPVQIRSGVFRNLCRMRYGKDTEVVFNQWKRTAVSLGHSPLSIDKETALIIWYVEKKRNNDNNDP